MIGSGRGPLAASVTPRPRGLSITATDPATKMFRPLPAYLIYSLWLRRLKSSVGSRRGSMTGTIFPEAVRCMAGFDGDAAVCAAVGDGDDEAGHNS